VRWLCLRPLQQLDQHEREALDDVLDNDEHLATGYQLLQRFRRLVVCKNAHDLGKWIEDAQASGLRQFASLAHGIQSDLTAALNGLRFDWSTGPVEGDVTRTKLFKRQGYGRASTCLLKRRIVNAACARPTARANCQNEVLHRNPGRPFSGEINTC
jgi:transposase